MVNNQIKKMEENPKAIKPDFVLTDSPAKEAKISPRQFNPILNGISTLGELRVLLPRKGTWYDADSLEQVRDPDKRALAVEECFKSGIEADLFEGPDSLLRVRGLPEDEPFRVTTERHMRNGLVYETIAVDRLSDLAPDVEDDEFDEFDEDEQFDEENDLPSQD
jgi:hypothetical protein